MIYIVHIYKICKKCIYICAILKSQFCIFKHEEYLNIEDKVKWILLGTRSPFGHVVIERNG